MWNVWENLRRYLSGDDGAVTVDWVVLTALIVGLAAPVGINYVGQLTAATQVVSSNIEGLSTLIPASLLP